MYAKIVENRQDTNEVVIIDNRIFSECVNNQLKEVRERAKKMIIDVVPEFKQSNAALGLLSQQEIDDMKNHIQTIRNQSNALEAQINAIVWDGQESTRSSACDSVQAIFWRD